MGLLVYAEGGNSYDVSNINEGLGSVRRVVITLMLHRAHIRPKLRALTYVYNEVWIRSEKRQVSLVLNIRSCLLAWKWMESSQSDIDFL